MVADTMRNGVSPPRSWSNCKARRASNWGKRIVGENHVQPRLQVRQVVLLCLHPPPYGVEPGPAQFMHHQRGIGRSVFQNQHV